MSEESVQTDREAFRAQLAKSLEQWQQDGIKGIWLKLGTRNAHLIDIALQDG